MKKILSLLAAAALGLSVSLAEAATPKAAEDPTATVVSVGTPAPRVRKAPSTTGKKTTAKRAGKGKKVQKRTRSRGK